MQSLRRRLPQLGTLLLLASLTCSDLDRVEVSTEAEYTVEGAPKLAQLANRIGFNKFAGMDISDEEELANQGVEKNQIDSVKIRTATVTITNTSAGQNFDFVDSVEFYVESDGLDRVRIASVSGIAAGLTTIGLEIDDVELAPYATAESMTITTDLQGDPPAEDTTMLATIVMDVDINVDGAICGK